ncbi:hypothetical protein [Streptomyces sp. NRRL S-495]|uniref:hypothetical protein n=1 Tax=Streptomyces sp. NRRL S-495 TaxID=1609133 RepID=UPI000B2B86AC|nr:hypothetical protein [Streptomyces sp. NRRL S-495]
MTSKPFPPELRYWGTGRCAAYVKIGPGELDYEREVAGYAYASAHLTEREAPQPHANLSFVPPGRVVRDLPLETKPRRPVAGRRGRCPRGLPRLARYGPCSHEGG